MASHATLSTAKGQQVGLACSAAVQLCAKGGGGGGNEVLLTLDLCGYSIEMVDPAHLETIYM